MTWYHDTLMQSREAWRYLRQQGLASDELVQYFGVGCAQGNLMRGLASRHPAPRQLERDLRAIGVLRRSGTEHLAGYLVIPIPDLDGRHVRANGRRLPGGAGAPPHLYLRGPLQGVWNPTGLADAPEIILCESLLDAMTFWLAGLRNVTVTYGARALTGSQVKVLCWERRPRRLLLAFDADEAGDRAATGVAAAMASLGIS